jgi:iron(III) transport system permease protein
MKTKANRDIWSVMKIVILVFVALAILYPLSTIVIRSVTTEAGEVTGKNFLKFFTKPYYLDVLSNTMFVAGVTTLFSVVLGVGMAYALTRYDIRIKRILNICIILSLMSPPFIGAYSWILLFGRSGFVTTKALEWFGWVLPTIYGKWGIVSVFVCKMFPYVYLFTSGALGSIDSSLEEAAENLGSTKGYRLFHVTLPLVSPSILAGAVMVFMSAVSDFGTPMLIGENYKVLSTLVYEQYMSEMGTSSNFASAVSMIVIALCLILLLLQRWYLRRRNYNMTSLRPPQPIRLSVGKKILLLLPVLAVVLFSLLPQIVVIVTSFKNCNGPYFVAGWGLESYRTIFTRMIRGIKNTYFFSLIALVMMVMIGSITAYLSVRKRSALTTAVDLSLMVPYVIPGAVMGLALIIAFNRSPFFWAGTAFIMILCYTIRKIPYTVRSASGFLQQMELCVEEASINLGVSPARTFFKITLPLMLPGVVSGAILSWIETINELSSSVLLYTGKTITMSVAIYNEVARNSFGTAAAMATILTISAVIMLIVFNHVSKGKVSIV